MSKKYRVVMRESSAGTVAQLIEARQMLIQSGALEHLATIRPSLGPDEFHFLLFSMAPPGAKLQQIAAQLPGETPLIFRTTLIAECETDVSELHESVLPYVVLDEIDVPF